MTIAQSKCFSRDLSRRKPCSLSLLLELLSADFQVMPTKVNAMGKGTSTLCISILVSRAHRCNGGQLVYNVREKGLRRGNIARNILKKCIYNIIRSLWMTLKFKSTTFIDVMNSWSHYYYYYLCFLMQNLCKNINSRTIFTHCVRYSSICFHHDCSSAAPQDYWMLAAWLRGSGSR